MEGSPKQKWLFIFDMDHTILQENTDVEIRDLLPNDEKEKIEKEEYVHWIHTMQTFFDSMKLHGIKVDDIEKRVKKLTLTLGFQELFHFLASIRNDKESKIEVDVIIISGANTLFVEWSIDHHNLKDVVDEYHSINAKIVDDKIVLTPLNIHDCKKCDVSICKKKAVEDISQSRSLKGIVYHKLIFVGDGSNDFCACLALNSFENSIVYCRKNYALYRKLFVAKNHEINREALNSEVVVWESGYDIVDHLKSIINV